MALMASNERWTILRRGKYYYAIFFFFAEDRLDFKFSLYDAVVWLFITLYDDVE